MWLPHPFSIFNRFTPPMLYSASLLSWRQSSSHFLSEVSKYTDSSRSFSTRRLSHPAYYTPLTPVSSTDMPCVQPPFTRGISARAQWCLLSLYLVPLAAQSHHSSLLLLHSLFHNFLHLSLSLRHYLHIAQPLSSGQTRVIAKWKRIFESNKKNRR